MKGGRAARRDPRRRLLTAACALLALPLWGRDNGCADCHIAQPELPSFRHVQDWRSSVHGRKEVGCEGCHGGDPSTFRKFLAHRGVAPASDPDSRLHPANLPATCGGCHPAIYDAFQSSSHWELLQSDPSEAPPTCTSCHGEVALQSLGPNGLRVSCSRCHGEGEEAARPEYVADGQTALRTLRQTARRLKQARAILRKSEEDARLDELEAGLLAAQRELDQALELGHGFELEAMIDRLDRAQARLEGLAPTERR